MKEPMNMRALGECPGWVVDENGRMRHVTAWNPEGIWPEHAPAIAAAQHLEWRAKRLAELEAEREVNPVAMCGHGYTGLCMACVAQQDLLRIKS